MSKIFLETERLILRSLRESDLDDFHVYHCDPEICKFQSYDAFTIEDSIKFIEEQSRARFGTPGEWAQTGIELKETGKLVGDFALKPLKDEPRTVEIGVTLNPQFQGKGIAVEAFNKIFEHLFTETETHRIIGILDIENDGSRKLLENLNFRREAHFIKSYWDKGFNEWRDEYLYALLKEDWERSSTAETQRRRDFKDREINIKLEENEAIVLFEFLSRFSNDEILEIKDKSEENILWAIQCILEKKLVIPFSENYSEILDEARKTLKDKN